MHDALSPPTASTSTSTASTAGNSDSGDLHVVKPLNMPPVPTFPVRTASVPNFPPERLSSGSGSGRPFQTFQTKADWRLFLTVEERQLIRKKISSAYANRTQTYEELLQTCAAIEEELVFASAPSRLDYFKTGMQFEKRVSEKRKHLTDGPMGGNVGQSEPFSPGKPPVNSAPTNDNSDDMANKKQRC